MYAVNTLCFQMYAVAVIFIHTQDRVLGSLARELVSDCVPIFDNKRHAKHEVRRLWSQNALPSRE